MPASKRRLGTVQVKRPRTERELIIHSRLLNWRAAVCSSADTLVLSRLPVRLVRRRFLFGNQMPQVTLGVHGLMPVTLERCDSGSLLLDLCLKMELVFRKI